MSEAVDGTAPTRPAAVKSADRTVELLEVMSRSERQLTLTELHKELSYPKSSLYMLLQTLVSRGWVEVDPQRGSYGIGVRALLVGTSYLDHDPVVRTAIRVMEQVRQQINETVHLARLDGADVVYLASRESEHHLRVVSRVGRRLPAHATSLGKALLAERPDDEVREMLPARLVGLTPYTLTDHEGLAADLALTRARGYAVDHEENVLGLRCFGVAVRYQRPARDAISCSVPLARLTAGREEQIVSALLAARERLERVLR